MKLFSKIYRLNILAALIIFLLSSLAYYLVVSYVIVDQFDDSLQMDRVEIEKYAMHHKQLPQVIPVKDQVTTYELKDQFEPSSFETTLAYDTIGRDTADFRMLRFSVNAGGKWYNVRVGKSMEGSEHLLHIIIGITVATILLILVVSAIINRSVLKNLWTPFYNGLQLMRTYQVGQGNTYAFPESDTEEFALMNNVLKQAIGKADHDYLLLKEFTENASHEMQTPLAIIRSKLDNVIQDENVSARHSRSLQSVYQAIDKLTNLNHSLLLLTKIGNHQFSDTHDINIREQLTQKLDQFEEIISGKSLTITRELSDVAVSMNGELFDTLINNLISNAIRHNVSGGNIHISLEESRRLTVRNTGASKQLDKAKLFARFYKAYGNNNTGLGLSIIKEICIVSRCDINYQYDHGLHSFVVEWN